MLVADILLRTEQQGADANLLLLTLTAKNGTTVSSKRTGKVTFYVVVFGSVLQPFEFEMIQ